MAQKTQLPLGAPTTQIMLDSSVGLSTIINVSGNEDPNPRVSDTL